MEEVIQKYSSKLLGYSGYSDMEYSSSMLAEAKEIPWIMGEVCSHESALTSEGVNFLEEFYGFKNLADLLEKEGGLDETLRSSASIFQYLIDLKNYLHSEQEEK